MYTQDNIVSIVFSDEERKNIIIKFQHESELYPFNVEYDTESNQIKQLESWGWTYEKILDCVASERLVYQQSINSLVDARVKEKFDAVLVKMHSEREDYISVLKAEKEKDLKKIKASQISELKKLKNSKDSELQKIKDSKDSELTKIKNIKDSELQKIKDSKDSELQKIKTIKDEQLETLKKGSDTILEELKAVKAENQSFFENWVSDTLMMNTEPEALFKFKLAFFEQEQIKKTTGATKKRLRKAQSVIECFAILNEIYVEPAKP